LWTIGDTVNSGESVKVVKLAAVQVRSEPGQAEANRRHAMPFIEQAAAQGAGLVVLPELFSCGYVANRAIWDMGEARQGSTARWLAATAARLGIYLGAGLAESDGSGFSNVFILAGPDGQIAGRACKANAEANVFRRGRHDHLIVTPIGRIGVGICADNQYATHLALMHQLQADLVLMPHAWPTPAKAGGPVTGKDVAAQQRRMTELPVLYARALGVPVVFANQVGPLIPIGGLFGRLMNPKIYRLRGQSRIIGSDGTVLAELAEQEGAVVAAAVMDPGRKHYQPQPRYSGWLQPGPALARKVIIPLGITSGTLSYLLSRERRHKAQACLARTTSPTPAPSATAWPSS
jgi:N-carbamoylputrescine amidase